MKLHHISACVDRQLETIILVSTETGSLRGCTGFDRGLEVGEAIRSYALNANLNINAEDNNLALAA